MKATYFDDDGAIEPEGLRLLHDVMVELCSTAQIETKGPEAATLAAALVALYKSGFRTYSELMFMAAE